MSTEAHPGPKRFPEDRAHPRRGTLAPTRRAAVTAPYLRGGPCRHRPGRPGAPRPACAPPAPPAPPPPSPAPLRPEGSVHRGPRPGKLTAELDGKWGGGWRGRGGSFLLPGWTGCFLSSLGPGARARTHKLTAGAGGARRPTAWVADLGKLLFHSPSVLDENERGSAVETTGVRGGRDEEALLGGR